MVVALPFSKRQLPTVSSEWLSQYITTELSTIHDCYIAEHNESNIDSKLLVFVYENDAQNGRDSDDIQPLIGAGSFKNLPIPSD